MSEKAETVTTRAGTASLPPGPAVRRTPRRRRPTGAPPPLPHPVSVTTRAWLVLAVVVLAGVIVISVRAPSLRLDDQVNSAVLRLFARARTPWLTDVANGISAAGSGWGATVVGLSAVALTMAFRRWRHLLVFLCSLILLEIALQLITEGMTRPRPYGVPIIAGWAGYSAPALSVAILTFLLIGIAYCLVVPGRPRSYAKAAIAVIVTVFCLACLYLAVDHVDDLLLGVALGVAIPVSAFRFFTPNEVFPVAYRRGNTAHVDVTGVRGEAIRQGTRDQLGAHRHRDHAGRAGVLSRLHPAAAAGRRRPAGVPVRQALHQGPRPRRPLVQAVADHPVRLSGGRASLPDRAAPGRVRGLCPAPAAGRRDRRGQALRHRGDHPRAGVPAGHRVLRRRRGNRRRRRRRRRDRPGAAADPRAVGCGDRPPRHQAGQPDGPRRAAAIDRRGLRPGPPVAMAAGGRPGQHDAGPGGPRRPRAGVPAGAELFHRGRAGRGLRRYPRGRQPDTAARLHETRSPGPAGRVPQARPAAAPDRAAALEHPAGQPGRGDARHLRRDHLLRRRLVAAGHRDHRAARHAGRGHPRTRLRHRAIR